MTKIVDVDSIIGAPRIHRMKGFHYFYVEAVSLTEKDAEARLGELVGRVVALSETHRKPSEVAVIGPIVIIYQVTGKEHSSLSWMQVGLIVRPDTAPVGEARVRYVEPSLCASLLVWGDVGSIENGYGELHQAMQKSGIKDTMEWREWYLHMEGDSSRSNVILVQNVVQEK